MKRFAILVLLFASVAGAQSREANTLDLQSTIKGNQEQPKVLYIVPWQKISAPAAAYQPLNSLIQANFELVDRDEFRRGVAYRSATIAPEE